MPSLRAILIASLLLLPACPSLADRPLFIDAERALQLLFGDTLPQATTEDVSQAITLLAESLPPGSAIDLPRSRPSGRLDFRRVADNLQITGGYDGELILGPGQRGIQVLFAHLDWAIEPLDPPRDVAAGFADVRIMEKVSPASDLLGLFCSGSIRINADVKNCAWIGGENAFGARTVTANARVDDSLFLWFGLNWAFADYNGHRDPKNAGRDWMKNAQMHFNCQGGGQGTRLYLMVETNYGNPGPGVVLEDVNGMSLYHGSTERASSQGPGTYWLKNCQNVKLGLRGINAFMAPGLARSPQPSHDLTIVGGRGNILHGLRAWGYATGATAVNSDPELQAWMTSFQYEDEGFDGPGILKFAYTPYIEKPTAAALEQIRAGAAERATKIADAQKRPVDVVERELLTGRHVDQLLNATAEQTFRFGSDDLTQGVSKLANGRRLPPPPSMPATNAPRVDRPLAFTQADGFGKALLDLGADPTGQTPSDDAFARLMFGLTRDEVQAQLEKSYKADDDFRAAKAAGNTEAMQAARDRINEVIDALHPMDPARKPPANTKKINTYRVKRPRIDIPPGTFLLRRPLVMIGGNSQFFGAGPDRTILKTDQPIALIEHRGNGGTIANLSLEGGRVGITVTGADHHDPVSPTRQAYIAGAIYYALNFRNQTFAGMHVGNEDTDRAGGAEHDQNRYVGLKFMNTGQYGLFFNNDMLDKWLCLNCDFEGQTRAGISIKFNNLIHGGVIGCTFRGINGPGIDFMGGNSTIAYRPWAVMIDQCEFTECGSESQPAVDQGYGELLSFTRCTITTRNKTIAGGYRGSPQIMEDVAVDVKLAPGQPAVALRAARHVQTTRANGHALRGVRANGPVAFIYDVNDYDEFHRKTLQRAGKLPADGPVKIPWDSNPAAHELAPANGWVHPFVLYRCDFAGKQYTYALLNVDPKSGKVLSEIDLSPLEARD